jgi:hypothetical protein
MAGMDLSWLWQNLLTNVVWVVLSLAGATVLGILRAKKPAAAAPILYGVGGLACLFVIFFTATGHSVFSPTPTSQANIEENVKKWVSNFGYGSQSVPPPTPDCDFAYQITPTVGVPIEVFRDKKSRPSYLQIETLIAVSPEHEAILSRITPAQALGVIEETEAEILRRRMAFAMSGQNANHVQSITIIKSLPVEGLSQTGFGDGFDDVETAASLTRNLFLISLQKYGDVTTPLPTLKPQ